MSKIAWYKQKLEDIYAVLNSDIKGLSEKEVLARLLQYGKNKLPAKKQITLFQIIFNQFLNPFIYILLAAGVVSMLIGDLKDSFFIFLVIFINVAIGSFQEWKAEKSAETLQNLIEVFIKVKRDGQEIIINAEEIVPGDITIIESGNKVPADIRLITSVNLMADESLLTGESTAVQKKAENLDSEELHITEMSNMLFAGSVVNTGRAVGIVTETGIRTEIGKIAKAISSIDNSKPPLIHRMEKFAKHISYIVLAACIFIAVIEVLKGKSMIETFFLITALAVSAIPEGLPAAVTVALSVGMTRMSKRNVLIRKLTAVEGLGSCNLIASDKTGTLTINKQTVHVVAFPNGENYHLTEENNIEEGKIISESRLEMIPGRNIQLDELTKISVISNEANLYKSESEWVSSGDAIDIAILAMGIKYGLNRAEILKNIETVTEIPYESEQAYSAKFYKENENTKIAVKGAFEVIMSFCSSMIHNGIIIPIDQLSLNAEANKLAEKGYRIIAVASGIASEEKSNYNHNDLKSLTFLGFIGLIDPLRPEAVSSVEKCRKAGIKVLMITGDHPLTALTIGKQLKIAKSNEDVITGNEIKLMKEGQLKEIIISKSIFARVSPLQKLELIDSLIEAGNYVAVTGDGVNDAPALKKAHIGVAMGSGTDIAKEVSSIIITDDNFSSLVSGIEEGRYTYDNIRKVIYLLISTGMAEIVLFLLSLVANLPIPLIAVQLLWLNLVTNGIQGVALAFEKGEPSSMERPPRKQSEGIFNKLMIQETLLSSFTMALLVFACWLWLIKSGWEENSARNIILLFMVLFENFLVFNCRSEYTSAFKIPFKNNYFLIAGVFIAQGIHILAMQVPFMQNILKVQPVDHVTWIILLAGSSILILVMEIFKKQLSRTY